MPCAPRSPEPSPIPAIPVAFGPKPALPRPPLPPVEAASARRTDVVQQSFAATSTAARWARWHAAEVMKRWGLGKLEDVVVQIVSELVANAAARPAPPSGPPPVVRVTLRLLPTRVIVEVSDADPTRPVFMQAAVGDERGRGLEIVMALSCEVGVKSLPDGKVVIAQVRRPLRTGGGR